MSKTSVLSEKNTKKEILDAYQEIVTKFTSSVKEGKIPDKLPPLQEKLELVKQDLTMQAKALQGQVEKTIDDMVGQLYKTTLILQALLSAQIDLKFANREEEERIKRERTREQEEYNYEFTKKKQRQDEELKQIRESSEKKLKEQADQLKTQEDEFKQLKIQVDQFDQTLKKAVGEAVLQTTKNLESLHKQETVLLKQQYESNGKLLTQKIELLQINIGSQVKEIERLQLEVVGVQNHLTKIAERAVEKPMTRVYKSNQGQEQE